MHTSIESGSPKLVAPAPGEPPAAPPDFDIPDLSGTWKEVRDSGDIVLAGDKRMKIEGRPEVATIRLATDSKLGAALASTQFEFEVENNILNKIRIIGDSRQVESTFRIVAASANAIQMTEYATAKSAMLTVTKEGAIEIQGEKPGTQKFRRMKQS